MGMTDLEALLRPVSDDARCGPDLDAAGDPAYVEFGVAAEWKEAKYVGDQEVSPAQAPDWRKLKETGAALLAVSKDLRIAKHYVAALAHTDGLPGFDSGVRLLRDLLDRYWDALHPMLEGPDDDWRKNLVMDLNDERGALVVQVHDQVLAPIVVRPLEHRVQRVPVAVEQVAQQAHARGEARQAVGMGERGDIVLGDAQVLRYCEQRRAGFLELAPVGRLRGRDFLVADVLGFLPFGGHAELDVRRVARGIEVRPAAGVIADRTQQRLEVGHTHDA